MFDVALDDAAKDDRRTSSSSRPGGNRDGRDSGREGKRSKKDEKFGFGGKKRFAKSTDAASTGDMRSFSVKKMKGNNAKKQRPGKARRAKMS